MRIGPVKIFFVAILLLLAHSFQESSAQNARQNERQNEWQKNVRPNVRKVLKVDSGKKTVTEIRIDTAFSDSLKVETLVSDTLLKDTTALSDRGAVRDTLGRKKAGGVLKDSALMIPKERFSLLKDTISPTSHFLLSLVPGMGQIYNGQWYKAPVFVGLIGGFVAGGVAASNNYNDIRDDWHRAVDLNMPADVTEPLERKMKQAGTVRTLFYSAAAATYLYQIADATFKYRGYMNPVRKSTVLSAVFPGAGFIYTKTYWRLPIYYGGFAVAATVVDYNNRYYQRYKDAYDALTDGDPSTVDEFHGRYTEDQLANARDAYRRDRDLGIILMTGVYVVNIIDTYVTATLKNWEVDENLSATVQPTIFREYAYTKSGGYASGSGLSLVIRF